MTPGHLAAEYYSGTYPQTPLTQFMFCTMQTETWVNELLGGGGEKNRRSGWCWGQKGTLAMKSDMISKELTQYGKIKSIIVEYNVI